MNDIKTSMKGSSVVKLVEIEVAYTYATCWLVQKLVERQNSFL